MSTIVKRTSIALNKQDLKNLKKIMKTMKFTQSSAIKIALEAYARDLDKWLDPQNAETGLYQVTY